MYICTNCSDFLIAQLVKNLPEMQETLFNSWVGKICWRRDRLPTPVLLGFPCGSAGKESACNAGDLGLRRSPGEGNGTPLQHSCLENPMDGGAWWAAVHGIAKSRTRLRDFTFTFLHWRRKWQPTPVFLPGESQGRGSLVGCSLWGHTESDTTEAT